ncbi:MAG: alpha/beta hydrolase [Bacteroidetes bacterium]|nr:alpha/beta hydrolase [Bacteroidota bacterium]
MTGPALYILKEILRNFKKKSNYENIPATRLRLEQRLAKFNFALPSFRHESFEINGIEAEWIYPKSADESKVLLYFHGGGYAACSINTHRSLVSRILKHAGIKGLMINYRLAPEHPYPAAIEDAFTAYQWLLQSGYKPEQIAFGGDSAGGGLAIGALLYIRDNNMTMPKCVLAISPWLDHTFSGLSYHSLKEIDPMLIQEGLPIWSKNYLGDADPRSPYASPIFHNLSGLPPVYVQVGEEEIILDDSTRFADKAKAEGVDVTIEIFPKLFHVFQAFWLVLPAARKANRKLGEFLKSHLA